MFQRRIVMRALTVILFVGVLIGTYKLYVSYTLVNRIYQQAEKLRALPRQELFSGDDVAGSVTFLRSEFHTFKSDWDDLQTAIWPFDVLARQMTWLPQYGDDLEVGLQLFEVLDPLLESVVVLDTTFDPLLSDLPDDVVDPVFALDAVRQVKNSAELISDGQGYVTQAHELHSQIDLSGKSIHPQLQTASVQLERYFPWIFQAFALLNAAPDMAGIEKPHHVLVLVQNADEIRPTGGFITSIAYAVIQDGKISELTFLNSSSPTIDRVDKKDQYKAPPEPYIEFMRLPIWLFRDANWFPDFPTSARKASELYTLGRETPVDTVVAINQYSVRELLKITGSQVLDDGTVVDANNFIEVAHESWESRFYDIERERKQIVGELGERMIRSLSELSSRQELVRASNILLDMALQKRLYIYSDADSIQAFAYKIQADGSIPKNTEGDYVHIVDTNMSFDKTGLNIRKGFDYHVSLQDVENPYGVLTTRYANIAGAIDEKCSGRGVAWGRDYEARAVNCFGNYLRIYVPDGSVPQALPYFPIPEEYVWVEGQNPGQFAPIPDEYGKEVFAGLMILPPDYETQGRFVYGLDPDEVLRTDHNAHIHYPLTVQKQSGIEPYPISVTIDLPQSAQILAITPTPTAIQNNVVYFESIFDRDLQFDVEFRLQGD